MNRVTMISMFLVLNVMTSIVYATNLGVVGQVYPIQEEDFLSFIERKMATMQKNGDWQRMQKNIQQQVSKHIDRPAPITTITKTSERRTWDYDPSVIVPYDLHDTQGNIFAKAGTTVNPLAIIKLHTALVFYDADDKDQVQWAKKINHIYHGKIKLVLVRGSISRQESLFHQPIYFDQEGRLTKRLHIEHVPALVYQKGEHLKIEEVLP